MCSLGTEPTTYCAANALLYHEPQEHINIIIIFVVLPLQNSQWLLFWQNIWAKPPETTSTSTSKCQRLHRLTKNQNNAGQSYFTDNERSNRRTVNLFCNVHGFPRDLQAAQTQRSAKDGELPGVSHPARDYHGDADSRGGGRGLRARRRRLRSFTHRDLAPPERERGAPTETAAHRVHRCGAGVQRRENRGARWSVWW